MNILIATDKFKDSQTALQICEGLKKGILKTFPTAKVEILPLADGGEGTLETLQIVLGGEFITCEVQDPLFRNIQAQYLWIPSTRTAIVEMARASGIELLKKEQRNALITSTFGTGQLIMDTLKKDASEIILTVGGSATNDGGIGMAAALGYVFLDENENELKPVGENLLQIHSIDKSKVHPKLANIKFTIATDVTNPFYGENGAAKVFAKQKGADENAINLLDKGLENLAQIFQKEFNIDVQSIQGSGAGGGIGGGGLAFLNAQICSAADWILDISDIDEKLKNANVLITGEGKIDSQTWQGKLISRLVKRANKFNVPSILICGTMQDVEQIIAQEGVIYATSILNEPMSLEKAIENTSQLVEYQGNMIGKALRFER
ncbi:MAG: glycerate kinase [Arcicella sp.]|nr:glycerate kinase [Arcicella sp.]